MKKFEINEDDIKQIIQLAHEYGRSMQFNYGLFGPECKQALHFSLDKATDYINENIIKNLSEL